MADVATIIAEQKAAVDAELKLADGFLDRILNVTDVDLSGPLSVLPLAYTYAGNMAPVAASTTPSAPVISIPSVVVPSFLPVAVQLAQTVALPNQPAAPPTLGPISLPDTNLPSAPGATPAFALPSLPTAPGVTLPSMPTLASLQLPVVPSINMPRFTGVSPTDDLLAPTAAFQYTEELYTSTLLDPLKAKLLDNLTNGGYGIETNDEIALFNRARDREVELMLSKIEDAGRAMATRGFVLPPGELSIYVDRAYQDMQDKVSSASRDITLKRADLYVLNRQFTIEQTKGLEQILIGFHNSVRERALNVARLTVEMSIALFNALVARFNARLEKYKAEATVFTELIRGELAKVEIYKAEVEAVSVEAQMQRTQIETYLAQIRGIELSVQLYRAQMDAARIQADISKLALDAYRVQIEAYVAQVQAKSAEFGLYRAQIEGQRGQVELYDAQVRAYSTEASGKKIEADINIANMQTQVEQARINLSSYQGQIAGIEAQVRVGTELARTTSDVYRSKVEGARSVNEVNVANARIVVSTLEAELRNNVEVNKLRIENAKIRLEAAITSLKARIGGAEFAGTKYFALLTAMENTINVLAVQSGTA